VRAEGPRWAPERLWALPLTLLPEKRLGAAGDGSSESLPGTEE
jgi:hypothetical protein